MKMLKSRDLPESNKYYTLTMSDRKEYLVSGDQKSKIIDSKSQFIELPNGSLVNKSFLLRIDFCNERTVDMFRSLPSKEQQKILKSLAKT